MKLHTVTFRGASDDLVEVEGDAPGCDEYNAEDATFVVVGNRDGKLALMKVRVAFDMDNSGLWSVVMTPVRGFDTLPVVLDVEADQDATASVENVVYVGREFADA